MRAALYKTFVASHHFLVALFEGISDFSKGDRHQDPLGILQV